MRVSDYITEMQQAAKGARKQAVTGAAEEATKAQKAPLTSQALTAKPESVTATMPEVEVITASGTADLGTLQAVLHLSLCTYVMCKSPTQANLHDITCTPRLAL